MGVINVPLKLRNAMTGGPETDLMAKVDTGAALLVLPESTVRELRLPVIRRQTVKYANEERADRDIVFGVELEVCGRKGVFEAVVEPEKSYALLGAVVMESLDLIVEPRDFKLYPNPRSRLPMAEIE